MLAMLKDERDLLDVLKFELRFLESGGYGRSPREPWRPQFIFEDSPSCMNYDCKENPGPCEECVLMQLVPQGSRAQKIPCRFIPMNEAGETLDSMYRSAEQHEVEETVAGWLRATITRLEEERKTRPRESASPPAHLGPASKGSPLFQSLHPKCANPACPTAFHWTAGGKFFRFRPDPAPGNPGEQSPEPPGGIHGLRHFWLCERCSHILTLVYDDQHGVVLKLLWPELPASDPPKQLAPA